MIVYDGITAERDVPQRAWRPTSRCRSSAGVQRTASAQDGDAARFICGTAHTIWGGKSLRWDPPARRNRLHPQRYTVVRPTSLGSVGHRHFFADALSLRAGICRLARARLGQPAASYGTPWVDHIPPPPTATKGAPGSASDQFVHRRQHGEFFEHWWGNYLTRDTRPWSANSRSARRSRSATGHAQRTAAAARPRRSSPRQARPRLVV
jgi:hypothetical protein